MGYERNVRDRLTEDSHNVNLGWTVKDSDPSEKRFPHSPKKCRLAKMLAKGKNNLTRAMNGERPSAVHGLVIRWITGNLD